MTIIMCWIIAYQILLLSQLRPIGVVSECKQADHHDRYLNHSNYHLKISQYRVR